MSVELSRANVQRAHSYAELQEQMHRDLLAQHPEWIEPSGDCPKCDDYERRLAKLISIFESAAERAAA
jgi:hypothetical protein